MIITRISSFSFSGKIIDVHTHVGHHDGKHYSKKDLDVFVKEPLPNNDTVEKMFISDLDVLNSLSDEYYGNKRLLNEFKNESKYALLASCSPKDGNAEKIIKLFNDYPHDFIGLKFHPSFQDFDTTKSEYKPYMEFAQRNNLPCLFHTEVFLDNEGKLTDKLSKSDPEKIYNLAKNYKKTSVILAHMGAGWNEAHDKAINILVQSIKNNDANLYADISWVDIDADKINGSQHRTKEHIIKAIKTLKGIGNKDWKYGDQSFRLMFGTDAPLARFTYYENKNSINDYSNFVEDIKHAIKNDPDLKKDAEKIIDDLFYNNAKKLYLDNATTRSLKQLKSDIGYFSQNEKHSFKVKLAACLLIIAAGITNSFCRDKKQK